MPQSIVKSICYSIGDHVRQRLRFASDCVFGPVCKNVFSLGVRIEALKGSVSVLQESDSPEIECLKPSCTIIESKK